MQLESGEVNSLGTTGAPEHNRQGWEIAEERRASPRFILCVPGFKGEFR